MGCVDFTRLKWPSQIWLFEGSLSITSSIPFAGSGTHIGLTSSIIH